MDQVRAPPVPYLFAVASKQRFSKYYLNEFVTTNNLITKTKRQKCVPGLLLRYVEETMVHNIVKTNTK